MKRKNMQCIWICALISVTSAYREEWSLFVFSQEWPETTCRMGKEEKKRCFIPKDIISFVIHGLWPNNNGPKPGPENCTGSPFNMADLKKLQPELSKAWPNLYSNTKPDEFWRHEWDTHGKCALDLPATGSQYLYFKKALDLMSNYNISRYLQEAGIVANDTRPYDTQTVTKKLKSLLNSTPDLQCFTQKEKIIDFYGFTKQHSQLLAEIRVCMNKNFHLIDCSKESDSRLLFKPERKKREHTSPCKGKFTFPKIRRNRFASDDSYFLKEEIYLRKTKNIQD